MSLVKPEPGRYRRLRDGVEVTVIGCNGDTPLSSVTVQAGRRYYVQLGNFWKNYQAVGGGQS